MNKTIIINKLKKIKEGIINGGNIKKRVGIFMLILLSMVIFCFTIVFIMFSIKSKGEIEKFYNDNGSIVKESIAEKITVNINEVEQGMIIRGKNINNPVILFLHGGPGMPQYFLNEEYPTELENNYTVCWWEQRGAGLSYSKSLNAEKITNEQMIFDIIEVTNYLRDRFNKDKIYLLAHSGGTYYGIQTASRAPELFHAYIGMSQIVNTYESEVIAYNYMRNYYVEKDNMSMVNKFDKYFVNGTEDEFFDYMVSMLRDDTMHKLGIGTARQINSIFSGIFLPVMNCKAYTMQEKINIWKGKAFLRNHTSLLKDITKSNLTETITSLELPVYFISGIYDYTVNYDITKEYYENLQASSKGFYSFNNSAHSPLWEEPDKFIKIMNIDVSNCEYTLAD